jgi:DNA relaxase NicK
MRQTELVFAGVDYLRLTAQDHGPYEDWHGLLFAERLAEERAGRREHVRGMLGYYGNIGQHFFVGRNDAGCMVQVSGVLAHELFRALSLKGGRASRVDVQVSKFVAETPDAYLHRAFTYAKAAAKSVGRPVSIDLRDSNTGAKMLSIGSRESELYGRVYDKGKESKDAIWQGYVRWEVEVKGKQAADLHAWLLGDATRVHTVLPIVANFFKTRGLPIEWDGWADTTLPPPPSRTKTDAGRIAWLSTQVGPTVRELVKKGYALEVAQALLTDTADNGTIDSLATQLAESCHD